MFYFHMYRGVHIHEILCAGEIQNKLVYFIHCDNSESKIFYIEYNISLLYNIITNLYDCELHTYSEIIASHTTVDHFACWISHILSVGNGSFSVKARRSHRFYLLSSIAPSSFLSCRRSRRRFGV